MVFSILVSLLVSAPIDDLIDWVRQHDRFPLQRTKDPTEKSLARWVRNRGGQPIVFEKFPSDLRARPSLRLKAEPEKLLADLKAKPRPLSQEDDDYYFKARMLVEPWEVAVDFMREHRRLPRQTSGHKREARIAYWLNRKFAGGMKVILPKLPADLQTDPRILQCESSVRRAGFSETRISRE